MALSLDSIYRPFNEFFSHRFATSQGGSVTFRFAHLARAFEDSDFLIPQQPQGGPTQVIADELFSILVDVVPRLDADGRSVWLDSGNRLSDVYGDEILGPALPFVPAEITDLNEKQARIDAFNKVKADAIKDWNSNKAASLLQGPGVQFRPSFATPGNWWDRTASIWTHQSFQVMGAVTSAGQSHKVPDQLLRMRVTGVAKEAGPQSPVMARMQERRGITSPLASVASVSHTIGQQAMPMQSSTTVANQGGINAKIQFMQRLATERQLAQNAQRQPVTTNDVTISFDYCVVNVARPWLHNAFINNRSWYIPGQSKGKLSANDGHGPRALTNGFVAVKCLSIKAPWTSEDITNLELSVQFGPFNFDSTVVNGAIGHDGIQIIGWIFQDLPDLPPV
jgi:hypothetical protein